MKALIGALGVLLIWLAQTAETGSLARVQAPDPTPVMFAAPHAAIARDIEPEDLTAVVERYCQVCHNDRMLRGGMSLEGFDVENPMARTPTTERMIRKLRVGMMPPPGRRRPGGDTLLALVEELEQRIDRAAAANPDPGVRSFQRLNRPEYENSIRDLLGLEVNAENYLPPDTKSNNFDNIVDVQLMSPTLMDSYMRAAAEISRLAVGDPNVTSSEHVYWVPREASQADRAEGAPLGTRGGTSVIHNFPADGEYHFQAGIFAARNFAMHTAEVPEQLEIAIDGERVALLDIDRYLDELDYVVTEPVFIRTGPHRVSAAFIKSYEGPLADLVSPNDWTRSVLSSEGYGVQVLHHLRDLIIAGPNNVTGVSETPVRQRIFTCRPASSDEELPCADEILSRLASQAFRRPIRDEQREALMSLYEQGVEEGGFEVGIRTALEFILASPYFVFRFEESAPDGTSENYQINDFDLASRLSYFLWATPPDEQLRTLARDGKLSEPGGLERETRRMLADPRSEALSTRFVSQWLRLGDIDKVVPDMYTYPDYHRQLGDVMRTETELFFYDLVQNDGSVTELYTADYTFVNERLAKHYGIPGISGEEFRRVQYPDDVRRGLLGHGSVLTLTSLASRTSPVLRGKWVMEVILGSPPPPPPPGVPALDETEGSKDGRVLTTRERMEIHRADPVCNSCHRFMDPIGLALDNFDVTGKWRIRENGAPLDTRGELWDGSQVSSPSELQAALLKRQVSLLRNFTQNMMTYALGRRVEYYDMPVIRKIVASAEANDYRMSSFVLGVVDSDAFRMRRAEAAVEDQPNR